MRRFLFILLILFVSVLQSFAQKKITGVVTDKQGEPLTGVHIRQLNGKAMSVTDVDGKFTIVTDDSGSQMLLFSYLGMKPLTVKLGKKLDLTIVMESESRSIDEVVVNGYFNKKKSSFTGTAKTYDSEKLIGANSVNLLSALSILDPSFKMVENNQAGSNPNTLPEFQIRGGSSLPNQLQSNFSGNPNLPTFIMDGFEVSEEKVFDLDPTRIESMTILKDAAATAIYGSRAANGVVVITTKEPAVGKLRATYNLDVSYTTPDLTDYHLLNAKEKLELEKSAGYFDPYGSASQTEARMEDYNYRLGLVEKGYDTYWLNKPLHTAVGQKHSLSVEGGEKSIRYSLDLTYESAPGVMRGSGRNRMGAGTTLLYRFKNLTFKNTMTYDYVKATNSPYGTFDEYTSLNPYYPYKDADGNYLKILEQKSSITGRDYVFNPLYNTTLNTRDDTEYTQFIDNFEVDWFINDAFQLKASLALKNKKQSGNVFKPADHTDFANYEEDDYYRKGYYNVSQTKEFSYNTNLVLCYFKQIKKHSINVNAAWNMEVENDDMYSVRAEGFQDDHMDHISFALQYAKYQLPQGEDDKSRLMGFLMNASYSYRDTYLFDLSGRMDGSSKFGSDSRWAPFWSTGAGWNIHNEPFAKSWKWLNTLKLRASYGVTGSQAFSPYQALIMYQYLNEYRYRDYIGASMIGLGNPNLKWQQTYQVNLGLDLSLFNDRISFSGNYYRKLSKGLLTDVTLPPSLGYDSYRENLGEVQNEGYELDSRFTVLKSKDLWLNLIFSGVHNTNKLKKISNSLKAWNDAQDASTTNVTAPKVKFIEGQSINTIWGVRSYGINPANGKEIFISRDGTLTDVYSVNDQVPIGCTDSKLEGNLGLDAGYRGFKLNLYFRYRLGGQLYNSTLVNRIENANKRYNTDRRVLEQRWQKPGDITFFKDIKDETYTRPTSRFVQDYNYITLSSMTLSYDFPIAWTRPLKIENIRLSFAMNDLFFSSTVKQERGLSYPYSRSFRTSLRVIF